jgi:CBS domain-containing protein
MRRKRRISTEGTFSDPLKDYSPPEFADGLEEALCDNDMTAMDITPMVTVTLETTVSKTMQMMSEAGIACVLVIDEDQKLHGVFTERDVLDKVAEQYHMIKDLPVRVVMTHEPVCVYEMDMPAKALNLMATGNFRHVPVLDADDRLVGVLGPRRVTGFLSKHTM